jgi:hypothetical protein
VNVADHPVAVPDRSEYAVNRENTTLERAD